MTVLVLYEELAGYFLACISHFAEKYRADVHVIRARVNKEAPFVFDNVAIKLYDRESYSPAQLLQLAESIRPAAVFCAGWSYRPYLEIAKKFKPEIPVFVGFDNKWEGTLKQKIASWISPFYFKRMFSACFVPGEKQAEFAYRLGYPKEKVFKGAYSCDFDFFYNQYLESREQKEREFPKRFIYVGRYVPHKGVQGLWQAFIEVKEETGCDWELWCLGIGDVEPVKHPAIKHFGFVQPPGMPEYLKQTGVFILPSHFEPWGVVVHEFAAAGFPLLCSSEVGAAEVFLKNGYNGYGFRPGNKEEMKQAMLRIINSGSEELIAMGRKSIEKARQITPSTWGETVMNIIEHLKKRK